MITKPQERVLWKAMKAGRAGLWLGGHRGVGERLRGIGLLEYQGTWMRITRAGLEALLDYWTRRDAASGCIAYQEHRATVERELETLKALENA